VIKLLILGLLITCSCSAMGSVAVSVDASRPIGPFNPINRDFAEGGESADPEFLQPLVEPMRALHPRLIRFDHVLNHYLKVEVKDGKMAVDFTALDTQIDIIRAMGAQPLMCLTFTPDIVGGGINPPNDLRLWHELIYRLVRHVNGPALSSSKGERKLGVEYWEIWNEPNLKNFWSGSMEQFLELYAVTEKAVIRADPSVKFGGAGFYSFPREWVRAAMEQAKEKNLRMDFISWHDYNDAGLGIIRQVATARAWCKELGMNPELIIDEWNYYPILREGHDDHNGAVYIADLLCTLTDLGIGHAPFFEIKDGPGEKRYWGRWGLFTADHHPKASYYAFLGFAHMEGNRLSFTGGKVVDPAENVNGGKAKVGGMAVGQGKRVDIVLYNTSLKQDETIDLTISGLGKSAVKAQVFLIDVTHSNPALTGREEGLERVDQQTIRPRDGVARMKVSLPKRSVAFIRM
jgi:hypothetical protein